MRCLTAVVLTASHQATWDELKASDNRLSLRRLLPRYRKVSGFVGAKLRRRPMGRDDSLYIGEALYALWIYQDGLNPA